MPNHQVIDVSIASGLSFLTAKQRADGGFISYSSLATDAARTKQARLTTFVPSLILGALAPLKQPAATVIREKLCTFVLEQGSANGSYNYWAKKAPERELQPYPDDLDDTFCALIGLYLHDATIIDEATMAKAVKLLLATESAVGGPYRTWLVSTDSEPAWLDVDIAVNAVIGYFLSLTASRLPVLDRFLGTAVRKDHMTSPYYPEPYPILYYISRVCPNHERGRLLSRIRHTLRQADLSPLAIALCMTASLNLGEARPDVAAKLLVNQQPDGSWPNIAFCADPVQNHQPQTHGAEVLTTAFALEALQRTVAATNTQRTVIQVSSEGSISEEVLLMALQQLGSVPADLREQSLQMLSKLAGSGTGKEIVGLPFGVSQSLRNRQSAPSENALLMLGLANLYGWLAYSIYDDLLDGEGQAAQLPVANLTLRRSLAGFSDILPFHRPFQEHVKHTFDRIDAANAWEVAHCRFIRRERFLVVGELPDYGSLDMLADRSLGHALPPLGVLLLSGVDDTTGDFVHLQKAMSHYLIARQLNDDAHDWPDDLKQGRITYVVGLLLTAGPGRTPGKYLMRELLAAAQQHFWRIGLPVICREIQKQVKLGRADLREISSLKRHNHIATLLDGIDTSVKDTLAKHKAAQAFLKHYEKSSVKA